MSIETLNPNKLEPETSGVFKVEQNLPDQLTGNSENNELASLPDAEYLAASQDFGNDYVGLLSGHITTEHQYQLSDSIDTELRPLLENTKGLKGKDLAGLLITGYRAAVNKLYVENGHNPMFEHEDIEDDLRTHIIDVAEGPFGVPIVYTDGNNEKLFGYDSLSFACSELMIENDLPPLVVVFNGYNPDERDKVTTHETSHMIFALLKASGSISVPEVEGITETGRKSTFELARDEAIAQMAANQNSATHPSVVKYMIKDGADETACKEYVDMVGKFSRIKAEQGGLKFSDAILGVVMARNFTELYSHMERMGHIAEIRLVVGYENDTPEVS